MTNINLKRQINETELLRIGAYAQMEGTVSVCRGGNGGTGYRFLFCTNQISDIEDLVTKIASSYGNRLARNGHRISFYSKKLYDVLQNMGFHNFNTFNWNIPSCIHSSPSLKKEYLRCAIDSLGDIDIQGTTPYVAISSVNTDSMKKLSRLYGGRYYEYDNSSQNRVGRVQWKGRDALGVCEYIDWKAYCHRNIRGLELVRHVRWDMVLGV